MTQGCVRRGAPRECLRRLGEAPSPRSTRPVSPERAAAWLWVGTFRSLEETRGVRGQEPRSARRSVSPRRRNRAGQLPREPACCPPAPRPATNAQARAGRVASGLKRKCFQSSGSCSRSGKCGRRCGAPVPGFLRRESRAALGVRSAISGRVRRGAAVTTRSHTCARPCPPASRPRPPPGLGHHHPRGLWDRSRNWGGAGHGASLLTPLAQPSSSAAPRTPGPAAFRGTTRRLRPILSVDGDRCGLRLLPLSNDATANSLSRLRVAFHALWGDVLSLGHSASVCPAISETTRVISKAAGS